MIRHNKSQDKIIINAALRSELNQVIQNTTLFKNKLQWLRSKWDSILKTLGDCQEIRMISPIIQGTLTPLNASIIADNLEYFRKKYSLDNNDENHKNFLIACLCGSKNIANFLLEKLVKKPDLSFILTYVAASQNEGWAQEITLEMKKEGLQKSPDFNLFCTEKNIKDAVEAIFNDKNKIANK